MESLSQLEIRVGDANEAVTRVKDLLKTEKVELQKLNDIPSTDLDSDRAKTFIEGKIRKYEQDLADAERTLLHAQMDLYNRKEKEAAEKAAAEKEAVEKRPRNFLINIFGRRKTGGKRSKKHTKKRHRKKHHKKRSKKRRTKKYLR